jgi:CheY-like chemotaxis protein
MKNRRCVLLIEDSQNDADLFERYLIRACPGTHLERVDCMNGLHAALKSGAWDTIVLDANVPGLGMHDVLRTLSQENIRAPTLVVTGDSRGLAEDAMRTGSAGLEVYSKNDFALAADAVRRHLEA